MRNKVSRIVIVTNLWISFLITNDFSKLDDIIFTRESVLVFSNALLEEFLEVAGRPKFRRFFSHADIESLVETIQENADFVMVAA